MTNPRLNQVKDILKPSEYRSDDTSLLTSLNPVETIDRESLFNKVQASTSEISSSLTEFGVVEVNNVMRLIAPAKYRETERYLLDTILENSWQLDHIDEQNMCKHAPHLEKDLLRLVLNRLGTQSSSDENMWILNFDNVAKACAHDLFIHHTAGNSNKVLSRLFFVY